MISSRERRWHHRHGAADAQTLWSEGEAVEFRPLLEPPKSPSPQGLARVDCSLQTELGPLVQASPLPGTRSSPSACQALWKQVQPTLWFRDISQQGGEEICPLLGEGST